MKEADAENALVKAGVESARKESGGSLAKTLDEKIAPVRGDTKTPPSKNSITGQMLKESIAPVISSAKNARKTAISQFNWQDSINKSVAIIKEHYDSYKNSK